MGLRFNLHDQCQPSPGPLRRRAAALLVALGATAALPGATRAATFAEVLEQAWAPRAEALAARRERATAELESARSLLPGAPSLKLGGRIDALNQRRGEREWEAELAAPLWWPGQRGQQQAAAQSEQTLELRRQRLERWQLAGELREAWWTLALAEADEAAAAGRLAQAEGLQQDVQRRVAAGDLAALDAHLAGIAQRDAAVEQRRSQLARLAAERQFIALSAGAQRPRTAEELPAPLAVNTAADTAAATAAASVVDPESNGPGADHPLLEEGQARLQLAQARLTLAQTEGREAPELSLGLTRERGAALEPWQNSARVALRWPLGDDSRQRPRQRAAEAEVAEAALALDQTRRQQAAALATARTELQEARRMALLQQERHALAGEALDWTRQAFQAGQFDLPTLLRAQAEAASARAQAQRARLEADRAASRLLQTLGWMP